MLSRTVKYLLSTERAAFGVHWRMLAVAALLCTSLSCDLVGSRSNVNKKDQKTSNTSSAGKSFKENLPAGFAVPDDDTGRRLLADYGAMFVARGGAVPPPVVIFSDDGELDRWQKSVSSTREDFGGIVIELQAPAMTALLEARREARAADLDIKPRGTDAAKRSYADTVRLWQSRVDPGLTHWVKEGRLTESEASRLRGMSPRDQIPEILRLEGKGIYFSKDFAKSILYSVAAPGSSQHLSMLAVDVAQFDDAEVRAILSRHGWFQTVSSDTPHFTFLGVTESELPGLGLKKETNSGRTFWIPQLD